MPLVNKNVNTIPAYKRVQGPVGPPPVLEHFIIIETSAYSGGGVEYVIQENPPTPGDKMKIETAP